MCGVSVLCIAATGGRVGGMGVCVWRPPVGAGAETEAERHSQAKDNAVCVCVCVCVCVVWGEGVCVWGAGCLWAVWGGGMRVCTPCGGGGVCGCVCGCVWCVGCACRWCGQRQRDAARRQGGRSVCVWVCTWGVWCAGGRRQRNVHGWISRIIRLCFLSAFITSAIQTTPVRDR